MSNGRCPTCATASGGAASGTASSDMQTAALAWCVEVAGRRQHRSPGRRRSPAAVFAAVEAAALSAVAASSRSSWRAWSTPEGRPGLPHQGRQGALLGAVAAHRPPRRRPRGRPHRRGVRRRRSWSRPGRGSSGAARPTTPTTRPRRWRSSCAPRRGAAAAPPSWAPHVAELIGELLEINALHRLRSAQGVIGLADKHGADAARRRLPAGDRGRRPDLSHGERDPRRRDRDRRRPSTPPHARPAGARAHLHGTRTGLFAIDQRRGRRR